jgi:AAA family ATP:ADP antiporter
LRLDRIIAVEKNERWLLVWSFAYFLCLLSSYYVLRPVRDEMGIQAGVQNMQWLFTGTFVVMLAAVPLFGWVATRFPRRRMLPLVYWFFTAALVGFFALLKSGTAQTIVASAFFIWVSVFNLFVVSVFWSFMADIFNHQQAKRLFGIIAAGGSAGAIAGPALTAALAPALGPVNLLLVSAFFLLLAIVCVHRLVAHAAPIASSPRNEQPLAGGILAGVRLIISSPFLISICAYMLLYTTLSTFLYFEQARIVQEAITVSADRTRLFASMDLAVNSLTLLGQVLFTGRLVTRFGLTVALAAIPLLTLFGFMTLALFAGLSVLVIFQVVRRAGDFVLARPAREILFTLVNREARYKSKNIIDTLVYRGGDAVSGWLVAGLKALGAGTAMVAWAAVPFAALWVFVAYLLGRKQQTLAHSGDSARASAVATGEKRNDMGARADLATSQPPRGVEALGRSIGGSSDDPA